jgi:hypothetical protein
LFICFGGWFLLNNKQRQKQKYEGMENVKKQIIIAKYMRLLKRIEMLTLDDGQ